MYLFHPRVSQHLTSSRLLRRKAKKPRVLRLNPNSQSAGHCGRDSNLWEETVFKEKKAPPPPPPGGVQMDDFAKATTACARFSTKARAPSPTTWTQQQLSKGEREEQVQVLAIPRGALPSTSPFRVFPRSIRLSSNKPQPSHEDHWGGGGGAWNTLQTIKCCIHIRHWFTLKSHFKRKFFLRCSGVFAKMCFMILPRPLILCWDCSRTKNY